MSKLGPADSMEKKMTENGPLVQKLAFLAIFTIPYPTQPYKTCIKVLVRACQKRGKKDDWKRTIGSEVSILAILFPFQPQIYFGIRYKFVS